MMTWIQTTLVSFFFLIAVKRQCDYMYSNKGNYLIGVVHLWIGRVDPLSSLWDIEACMVLEKELKFYILI